MDYSIMDNWKMLFNARQEPTGLNPDWFWDSVPF